MDASLIAFGLMAAMFAANFLMKRRFGLLGLALGAGALISQYGAGYVVDFLRQFGLDTYDANAEMLLMILPAAIFLFVGPTYNKLYLRLLGSAAFALLAFAFLMRPLGTLVEFTAAGMTIFTVFEEYRDTIIAVGLAVAVVDIILGAVSFGKKHTARKTAH